MASIGHVAVGMVLGRYEAGRSSSGRLAASMALFSALALLPDADVIAFKLGIPYAASIGPGMFSPRGLYVVAVELAAFLPCWAFALWPRRRAAPES
jgi:inner membrane protein